MFTMVFFKDWTTFSAHSHRGRMEMMDSVQSRGRGPLSAEMVKSIGSLVFDQDEQCAVSGARTTNGMCRKI